jgi:hypothetical protein
MKWGIRLPSELWMLARTRGKCVFMSCSSGEYDADDVTSTPPSETEGKTDDSHKGEGFLKSAWHKLMNTTKGSESEGQPGEHNKKESGETKNEQKDQQTKNQESKNGEEQKKSSSGSN